MTARSHTLGARPHNPRVRLTHHPIVRLLLLLAALPMAWLLHDPQTPPAPFDSCDLPGGGDSGKAFSWFEDPAVIVGDGAGPFDPDATARTASAGILSPWVAGLHPAPAGLQHSDAAPPEPAAFALLTLLGAVIALRRHHQPAPSPATPRHLEHGFAAAITHP